jgi:nicotinamide riboside kinase
VSQRLTAQSGRETGPLVVGLIGGECSGKTSLARALVGGSGGVHVEERLRAFVDEFGRPPAESEQSGLMCEQEVAEEVAIGTAFTTNRGLVVCDPAAFMTAVYSIAYYRDDSLLAPAIEHLARYDALVWCDTAIPWKADGAQRDGPAERDRVDAILREIIDNHSIAVTRTHGTIAQRLATVYGLLDRQ